MYVSGYEVLLQTSPHPCTVVVVMVVIGMVAMSTVIPSGLNATERTHGGLRGLCRHESILAQLAVMLRCMVAFYCLLMYCIQW